MYFCPIPNTIIVGSSATTTPAPMTPQLIPVLDINELSATGTVILSLELSTVTAMKSSFQILMNAKQKIAAIPGSVIGRMTFVSACRRLHPSILAASSSDAGILSKKLFPMTVQNATTVATYTKPSAIRLLMRWKKEKIVMEARKMFLVFRGFLCVRERKKEILSIIKEK